MKTLTRRKFLKNVLYGVGLTLVGTHSTILFGRSSVKNNLENSDSVTLLQQFEEARTLFHKKKIAESENLYRSMLAGLPAHISIYDCYKNLLSRESRTDEIIPYYKRAIEKYPDRADFYDRLAKTYREIATGNKKLEKRVCGEENQADLIGLAVGWYERAIKQVPGKKFLYFGLLDTLYACNGKKNQSVKSGSRSALPVNAVPDMEERHQQLTEPYIQEWLVRKNPVKEESIGYARVSASIPVQIRMKIEKIMNKDRRVLYDPFEIECRAKEMKKAIKKLNMRLHAYYIREKKYEELTNLTLEMLRDNPDESQVLGNARNVLQKAVRPELELQLYQERIKSFNDFWTQAGLAKAYLHNGAIAKAQSSFEKLPGAVTLRAGKKVDLIYRGLCECAIIGKNYTDGREYILKGIELTSGLGGVATSLLFKYAECLCLENKHHQAISLLRKRLDPNDTVNVSDPVSRYIAPDMGTSTELYYLHQFYNRQKKVHAEEKVSLWCAIARIQQKTGDRSGLEKTCGEIEALIPSHPFVRKIKSNL